MMFLIKNCLRLSFVFLLLSVIPFSCPSAQESLPEVIKKVQGSIVLITTYNEKGDLLGQGSGFFITKNGEVVTCRHVLKGAIKREVQTTAGKKYAVKEIVAEDKEGDLIRFSIDLQKDTVEPLSLSISAPLPGERVAVIGSPWGLEATVSDGIVSAVRDVPGFGKIIQITVPISPGSSGSPVINLKGEVVGIVSFYLTEGQNLNFAISSERIERLLTGKDKNLAQTWTEWTARLKSEEPETAVVSNPSDKKNSVNFEMPAPTGGDFTEEESREAVYLRVTGAENLEEDDEERICYLDGKEIAKLIWNGETWVWDGTEKIPDGLLKVYNKDGQLRKEVNLIGEKEEGLCKVYFKNGKVMGEANYKEGVLEGPSKSYYKNGNLETEQNWKSDNRDGIYKSFYENGQIKEEKNYEDGELNSITGAGGEFSRLEKTYGEKGNLQEARCWERGRLLWRNIFDEHGKFIKRNTIHYYGGVYGLWGGDSGRVNMIVTEKRVKDEIKMDEWSRGIIPGEKVVFDGPAYYFYDRGDAVGEHMLRSLLDLGIPAKEYTAIQCTENYKDGKLNGESRSYDENGLLKLERNYKNGELDGVDKFYSDSGLLQLEANYKNGKKSGVQKSYYDSGLLERETNFKNGEKNGVQKHYDENGSLSVLRVESNWKDGKEDGRTKIYWEDGNTIAYLDTYKNGEKINRKSYNVYGKLLWEQDYPYTLGVDKKENKQEGSKK